MESFQTGCFLKLQDFFERRTFRDGVMHSFEYGPPLSLEEIQELEKSLPLGLPSAMKPFLSENFSWLDARYEVKSPERSFLGGQRRIYGGPQFHSLESVQEGYIRYFHNCTVGYNHSEEDVSMMNKSSPFCFIGNGDYLAFLEPQNPDSPVSFICHDGECFTISDSFGEFLEKWQSMLYAGPEIWILCHWLEEKRNSDGFSIQDESPNSQILEKLLFD